MLTISALRTVPQNPTILRRSIFFVPKNPTFQLFLSTTMSSSSKVVAEYAKSNRSSCKKCAKTIDAKTLRLGLVTRDSRGFDMTKWHHLNCLPFNSSSIPSANSIGGFQSLKNSDQDALKKLIEHGDQSEEKVIDGDKDTTKGSKKRTSKVHDGDEDEDKINSKKIKLSPPNEVAKLDLSFSMSDIQDKYKDANLLPKWKAFQTVIFLERDDGLSDSSKIAAFDFDGCLAKTSLKRVGPNAWSLMYPSIPEKLRSLYRDGYKLVIFTNESNIDRWKNKRQVAWTQKLDASTILSRKWKSLFRCLLVALIRVASTLKVFIACGIGKSGDKAGDPFRKPEPGMWRIMEQHFNSGIAINMDQSFYVGDAAGRLNRDHSDADIKFAEAIGLKFSVPEDYFQ